jgi:hypothetical protein
VIRGRDWSTFRVLNDRRPWQVVFTEENVIDFGGPARELVSEFTADICSPNCGLVVQTPNGRANVGNYRDCVVPFGDSANYLYLLFVGSFIAICIRSGLAEDSRFPPLVWDYLANGSLTIERLFEIDQDYAKLINSLEEAFDRGMAEDEFAQAFRLPFVVLDITSQQISLCERGRSEMLTLRKCRRFIALANEFRLE